MLFLLRAAAWGGEAEAFRKALAEGDQGRMAALALRPTRDVEYAAILEQLLLAGDLPAAERLAEMRSGAPEGAGLLRQVAAWRAGPRPGAEAVDRQQMALVLVQQGRFAEALTLLDRMGAPARDTLFEARFHALRAQALTGREEHEEALAAWESAAEASERVGWVAQRQRALRQQTQESLLARQAAAAMRALTARIDLAARIGDDADCRDAHLVRARLRQEGGDGTGMREDLVAARDIALAANDTLLVARIEFQIGTSFLVTEGMPAEAWKFLERSIAGFRAASASAELDRARLNGAIALTQTARYADALPLLGEITGGELRPQALAQTAYVLRRLGQLEKSISAYREAIAAAPERARALAVELGEVHLLRWEVDEARRCFTEAGSPAGLAALQAMLGDRERSIALFEEALAGTSDEPLRGRLLLQRAALERDWGMRDRALADAGEAFRLFAKTPAEAGNVASAWGLIGDIHLRAGDMEKAWDSTFRGAALLVRLLDRQRAVPALVRTAMLARRLGRGDEAVERLSLAQTLAKEDRSLLALVRTAQAFFEKEPAARLDEAESLAGGDDARLAAIHAARALLDPQHAGTHAEAALAALDRRPDLAFETEVPLEAENAAFAASLRAGDLAGRGEADPALTALERARAGRMLWGLGGRDTLLGLTLKGDAFLAWRAARNAAFDASASGRRPDPEALGVSLRALPGAISAAQVRAALREGEAYVSILDDAVARVIVVVGRERSAAAVLDRERPLDAVAAAIDGARRLIVAPDGFFLRVPFETARWKDGAVADDFDVACVPAGDTFVRLRGAVPPAPALWEIPAGSGPLEMLRVGAPAGAFATGEGGADPAALAEALFRSGAAAAALRVTDGVPPALLERMRESLNGGADPFTAIHAAKRWTRSQEAWRNPVHWAGLVFWGVPR